jgi:hypothetical protein
VPATLLQLQLLTSNAACGNLGEDAAKVLAGEFDAANARRVQREVLLKR